ncbi:sugar-binding transcriptional regulator [Arthrobacter castelli]|uniref:sugar-binding transcriptional regulator n=1 Tax=Arthrobacter castelli TaxID=271431 RepID=UPI000400977C|nr:sugar-binding domain-containing protein [Arthrobacter castelli]
MADQSHEELLAEIGRAHYLDGKSKVEIANAHGMSRFHVARLLDEARSSGIVHIEVASPRPAAPADTALIEEVFGLTKVIVTDNSTDGGRGREILAEAAAAELSARARPGATVGIAWSRTLATVAKRVSRLPKCNFVQLAGALPAANDGHSFEILHRLGVLSGGQTWPLFAPLVVDDATTAASLRKQTEIATALTKADTLDLAVVAIGAWSPGLSTVWERVSNADRREATKAGAVTECSGRLINAEGMPVKTAMDERIMAVTIEQLQATREVIGVASGPERAEAVAAACRAGIVSTLIADEALVAALSALAAESDTTKGAG